MSEVVGSADGDEVMSFDVQDTSVGLQRDSASILLDSGPVQMQGCVAVNGAPRTPEGLVVWYFHGQRRNRTSTKCADVALCSINVEAQGGPALGQTAVRTREASIAPNMNTELYEN